MITWAMTVHQKIQGGHNFITLAIWIGIKPMPTRHKNQGLTTRPDTRRAECIMRHIYLLLNNGGNTQYKYQPYRPHTSL
jgi:hypothetical protein